MTGSERRRRLSSCLALTEARSRPRRPHKISQVLYSEGQSFAFTQVMRKTKPRGDYTNLRTVNASRMSVYLFHAYSGKSSEAAPLHVRQGSSEMSVPDTD